MPEWPENDDAVLLIHNPRCSKSRATHELLEKQGIDFRVRLYLDEPLGRAELLELKRWLDRPVAEWVRQGEGCYQEAGLSPESGDEELIEAMVRHPKLLERPIVVRRGRAEIGRPPERVLGLF